jgi:hypothetical protein
MASRFDPPQATAVIGHLQHRCVTLPMQANQAAPRASVADDVCQCFAGDLHDGGRRRAAELRPKVWVELKDGTDANRLEQFISQTSQRLDQLAIGQDARSQPEHVVAQVANDPIERIDDTLELRGDARLRYRRGKALDLHTDAEHQLDDILVQIVGNALAFGEHRKAPQLITNAAVLERDRCLCGERFEQREIRGLEGRLIRSSRDADRTKYVVRPRQRHRDNRADAQLLR